MAWCKVSLAAAGMLLVGCAPMAPALHLPEAPVPDRYPLAGMADAGLQAGELAWERAFADPQLRRLIAQALAHNRDLRSAALRVEEARAAWGIQRAELLPAAGVGMDASRARVPGDLNLAGRSVVSSQYQIGLGLATWEIDFWGRVRSLSDATLQAYLATDEARRAATLSLIAQVAQGWLALQELDERLVLARAAIASRNESLRIFTRRFEVGSASRLELAQVRTLAAQARALGAQLEQQRAQLGHALALLAGVPVPAAHEAGSTGLADAAIADVAAGLPSDLLTARPDIAAAERRLRSAHASIGAARAAFLPRVTLVGRLGVASAELDGLFDPGSRAWSFAPSISLPLFSAGRLQASLDVAELRRDQAVADYEKAIQMAFREVADALAARRWLGEQLAVQREALAAQSERARLARLRYDAGSAAFLEVLDAQRDLLAAEQQHVQAQRAVLSARVALYAALGGGSRAIAGAGEATRPHP